MKTPVAILGLMLFSLGSGVQAQQPAVGEVPVDIQAQPMQQALDEFARQTGLQVVFATEEVASGMTAPAVSGSYTPQAALERLLTNSGLQYEFINSKTVAIEEKVGEGKPVAQERSGVGMRLAQADAATPGASSSSQSAAGQSAPESGRESQDAQLEEIVVTAQKRLERLQDVPISISVLSGENLDQSTYQGAMDVLRSVPGVSLLPSSGVGGGGTMINVRGVGAAGQTFNGSSTVGYYVDEVPFSLIRDAITPDQNIFDLDRIEVLRGPQGTLYGASSVNGLIRVLTKDADLDDFELKARVTASSTDGAGEPNYRGDAAVNIPIIEGKLAARAVAGYEKSAGWITSAADDDFNHSDRKNFRLKVKAQLTDALSMGLTGWISRADRNALDQSTDVGTVPSTLSEPQAEDIDTYSLRMGYEGPYFSAMATTSYLRYLSEGSIDTVTFGLPGIRFENEFDSKGISQEILFNSRPDAPLKWTAGMLYRDLDELLVQQWPGAPFPFYLSYLENSKSWAAFTQVSRRFWSDKLEWTLGARYFKDEIDHQQMPATAAPGATLFHNNGSYEATTPRAVLTWYPNENRTAYVSYSEGFRSGLPLAYTVSVQVPDFPGVEPDKLKNYEVGAKLEMLGGRVSVDTAIYYIDWQDVQQAILSPFEGLQVVAPVNGESASGAGVDLAITARPTERVTLGLSAGWNDLALDEDVNVGLNNDSLFREGDRLSSSPERTASAFIEFSFPLGGGGYTGGWSIAGNYTSELNTYAVGAPERQKFSGDSIFVGRTLFSVDSPRGWRASLFVDNFTNEYPAMTFSGPPFEATIPRIRPRTVGMQVDYRFGVRRE